MNFTAKLLIKTLDQCGSLFKHSHRLPKKKQFTSELERSASRRIYVYLTYLCDFPRNYGGRLNF
jgi:hypothetical protein